MTAKPKSKAALAKHTWQLMFAYLMATHPVRQRALTARNLTANDARALWDLDLKQGRPIGSLAESWGCDPSNATFIIDRLEQAGLAERRPNPADRRVKLVLLTSKGAGIKAELLSEYHKPPPEISALSVADLELLAGLLEKLQPTAQETTDRDDTEQLPTTEV
jgi:DNA-binding MarR family transcriptional regulator